MEGMEQIFNNFGALFQVFGWYSLALIAGVVIIMVPINLLWKKMMKSDELSRLRKIVSFVSVYFVSLGAVAGFTAIVDAAHLSEVTYISGATLALGFCSQVMWEIVKLFRDYGWKKASAYIASRTEWKKVLKSFCAKNNIDTKIVDYISAEVEKNYIDKINIDAVTAFADNRLAMISEIQSKLKGFVEEDNLANAAVGIYELLKSAYIKESQNKS